MYLFMEMFCFVCTSAMPTLPDLTLEIVISPQVVVVAGFANDALPFHKNSPMR